MNELLGLSRLPLKSQKVPVDFGLVPVVVLPSTRVRRSYSVMFLGKGSSQFLPSSAKLVLGVLVVKPRLGGGVGVVGGGPGGGARVFGPLVHIMFFSFLGRGNSLSTF